MIVQYMIVQGSSLLDCVTATTKCILNASYSALNYCNVFYALN